MSSVLAVAPHPDDETLGCGGTLLRHRSEGAEIHWAIVTDMPSAGFPAARRKARESEIRKVASLYGFKSVHRLKFPAAGLDQVPMRALTEKISRLLKDIRPSIVYLPFPGDAHSDHRIVFEAASICVKWFRFPSVRRVLAYETLSETEFGVAPRSSAFNPNVFVDIGQNLAKKIEAMRRYAGEFGAHPFPRSPEAIQALARLRGAAAGCAAAEAFLLLRERILPDTEA